MSLEEEVAQLRSGQTGAAGSQGSGNGSADEGSSTGAGGAGTDAETRQSEKLKRLLEQAQDETGK